MFPPRLHSPIFTEGSLDVAGAGCTTRHHQALAYMTHDNTEGKRDRNRESGWETKAGLGDTKPVSR